MPSAEGREAIEWRLASLMEDPESKGNLPGQCHQRHQEQLDMIRDDEIKDQLRSLPALTIMKGMCEYEYEKDWQKEEMMEGGEGRFNMVGGRKEGQGTKVRNPGIDQVGPKLRIK